jgi:twitching motility protein PilT
MMAESGDLGMMTLEQDLKRLYMQKRISLENGVVASNNKRRFQQIMNLAPMGGGD